MLINAFTALSDRATGKPVQQIIASSVDPEDKAPIEELMANLSDEEQQSLRGLARKLMGLKAAQQLPEMGEAPEVESGRQGRSD